MGMNRICEQIKVPGIGVKHGFAWCQ